MDERAVSADALASFVVFADHLNFTRAAADLHISQCWPRNRPGYA
jgi:hypothetical protein